MRLIIVGVLRALGKKDENYIKLYGGIAKTRKNDMTYDMKIHVLFWNHKEIIIQKRFHRQLFNLSLVFTYLSLKKLNSTAQYAVCDFNEKSISRKTNTAWNEAQTKIVWNVIQSLKDSKSSCSLKSHQFRILRINFCYCRSWML